MRSDDALWPITAEFSDTRATDNHGTSGTNLTYNYGIYRSGYRYHERALGHGLDGDSQLTSLVVTLTDIRDRTYGLSCDYVTLDRDGMVPKFVVGEPLNSSADYNNLIKAGMIIPLAKGAFDIDVRLQDDQPDTPDEKDFEGAIDTGWIFRF